MRNCYNSINRIKALEFVKQIAPKLYNMYYQRLGTNYKLIHSDGTYDIMEDGGSQGDMATTILLAICQKASEKPIKDACKEENPNWKLDASWAYHDDAGVCGDFENCALYFKHMVSVYKEWNCIFNKEKCELILSKAFYGTNDNSNNDNSNICNNVINNVMIPKEFDNFNKIFDNYECLGVPLGDMDYIDKCVIYKIMQMNAQFNSIKLIDETKLEFDFVRKFNGICQLIYLLSNIDFNKDYQ